MVATGVSARGLDIRNVMHVINFDLPSIEHNGEDEYIHRIGQSPSISSYLLLTIVSGRTARIGNEGLATSFYNDRDEAMADFLVKTFVECGQALPDFFQDRAPEDTANLDFNDDSGAEEEEETGGQNTDGGALWGSAGDGMAAAAAAAEPIWGANDDAAAGGSW